MKNLHQHIEEVPLYNTLYNGKVRDFTFEQGFNDYPPLERNHLIEGFPNQWMTARLQAAIQEENIETTTTSGTSGQRIQILRKKDWWKDEYVRTYRYSDYLRNFDVGFGKKAILTTAICSNTTCYRDSPSYEDRINKLNTLYLNVGEDPNHWTKNDIERMAMELNKFQPEYLDADPIYLALFLNKLENYGLNKSIHFPRVVTLSYELVTSYARRFIQSRWHMPLLNLYGCTELGYIYLEQNGKLGRCPELSQVEFLPFFQEKGIYYLILTSTKNEFMPFVRFRIGDLVKIDPKTKPNDLTDDTQIEYLCGREKEVVFSSEGEPITPGEVDNALAELENNVLLYQVQLKGKTALFRYISIDHTSLTNNQKGEIVETLKRIFGETLDVQFKLERSIAPEASGKFANIKQLEKLCITIK